MTGRDAYFSLMAIRMLKLSQKTKIKLDQLHEMFFSVSCNWQKLEALLD